MSTNPVRAVLVGCGGMAGEWLKVAQAADSIELVGLVDLNRAAAEGRAAAFSLPAEIVFGTLAEAVKATGATVVLDVTIPSAHDTVTLEALTLGCHVLGEKPMSDTMHKAQAMLSAAREADRIYAVTQTRRANPGAMSVRRAVARGVIGPVQEVHSDFYLGPHFGGFRDEMDQPLIVDMAVHTFDNARQFTGADPVSVYCHSWNPGRSWYAGDASAMAIFELQSPAGEPIIYTYRGSWTHEGLPTDWNASWRLSGAQGTLSWDGAEGIRAETIADPDEEGFLREMKPVDVPLVEMEHTGHAYMIRQFAQRVARGAGFEDGQDLASPAQDNIKTLAMVLAAVESARTGRRVPVRW